VLPTSNFHLPTSNFQLPTSCFRLPTSNFVLPTVIKHPQNFYSKYPNPPQSLVN
jgi:hypothetical protein